MEDKIEKIKSLTREVDGRIASEEAELLYKLAYDCEGQGVIVEIGSFQGYSTIWLASGSRERKREKVYAVDPHCTDLHGNNELIFRGNLKQTGVDDYVIPIVKTSTEAAKDWSMPIRLLYIDGAHDYENAMNDFLLWEKYLINGGIVAFHDCYCIFWPDVGKVVSECIFNSDRFANAGCVNTIIYARKVEELTAHEKSEKDSLMKRLLPRIKAVDNCLQAESMIKSGRYEEAENLLRSCESDINDYITPEYRLLNLNSIGNYYRRIGRYEKAEKVFCEILAHSDNCNLGHKKYRALLSLGDLYLVQKKYAEAMNLYKEAISKEGLFKKGTWQALLGLGRCYFALGEYDKAEQNFTAALAIEGRSESERYFTLLGLGRSYYALKNYGQAEKRLAEAFSTADIEGESKVGAADSLVSCFFAQGKYDEISGVVEKVLLMDGVSEDVKINLVRKIKQRISNLSDSDRPKRVKYMPAQGERKNG